MKKNEMIHTALTDREVKDIVIALRMVADDLRSGDTEVLQSSRTNRDVADDNESLADRLFVELHDYPNEDQTQI